MDNNQEKVDRDTDLRKEATMGLVSGLFGIGLPVYLAWLGGSYAIKKYYPDFWKDGADYFGVQSEVKTGSREVGTKIVENGNEINPGEQLMLDHYGAASALALGATFLLFYALGRSFRRNNNA